MEDKGLTDDQRIAIIKQNLQEVLRLDIIEDVIRNQKRPLVIYWGTATTGRPHAGYFVCCMKIAEFLHAGCHVKILLADIHGFLDNMKAPLELVNFRAQYYKFCITALLRAVGVPLEKLEFVLGSSYQLTPKYTMDIFRLSSVVTEHDAKKAGAEVVKQVGSPFLSGLIYPLMQALDEEHLGVDAQFGGVDQRKIFTLAAECLPSINYKERAHIMTPMVPGLAGGKMSASDPDSKIDLLDGPEVVKKKIRKAYAAPKETEGNGLIEFIRYVLLPFSALGDAGKGTFTVVRREGEGDPLVYHSIEELKKDYAADVLTPQLLKSGVTEALNKILDPIQKDFQASKEWQDIETKAYPPPEKKQKKVKDRGTGHPGKKKENKPVSETKPDGSVVAPTEVKVGSSVDEAIEKLTVADKKAS